LRVSKNQQTLVEAGIETVGMTGSESGAAGECGL
jgi:hypothetical protein